MVSLPDIGLTFNWAAIAGQVMYWIGYVLLIAVIIGIFYAFYYLMSFRIKAEVIPLFGGATPESVSVGKPKVNRVKWVKHKTAWKPLWPLINKKEIEPFEERHIYPGNKIYVFEKGDIWLPGELHIDSETIGIKPVPHYIRNWQSLQHKKNAIEFAQHTFWEDNKYFIMGVVTVAICCVAALATVWLTYKFAGVGTSQISGLTQALKDFGGTISGVGPR